VFDSLINKKRTVIPQESFLIRACGLDSKKILPNDNYTNFEMKA